MSNNIIILGDSYSTYEGSIPAGYPTYYAKSGTPGHAPSKMEREQTWWGRLLTITGDNLLLNDSWSGSPVCYTGYNGTDCSKSGSFICRFKNYVNQGFFKENTVDTVFVFGGTNDFWAGAPLGEVKLSDWSEDDLYCVLPAFCYFMSALKAELPDAEICFIINTELRAEIGDCIELAGKHFGVKTVRLHDIDKIEGHPTVKGMAEICDQVLAVYENK